MRYVVRYEIIKANSPQQLSADVEEFCGQGWIPVGGLVIDPNPEIMMDVGLAKYMQAMVVYGSPISQ